MIPEITQDNLHLLLPGKVAAVVSLYADHTGTTYLDALSKFYKSKTYHLLEQESTKYWWLGPVGLYEEFIKE